MKKTLNLTKFPTFLDFKENSEAFRTFFYEA